MICWLHQVDVRGSSNAICMATCYIAMEREIDTWQLENAEKTQGTLSKASLLAIRR